MKWNPPSMYRNHGGGKPAGGSAQFWQRRTKIAAALYISASVSPAARSASIAKSVAERFDSIKGGATSFGFGFFGIARQYPQPPYCFSSGFQPSFSVSCRSLRYFTQASRAFTKSF